MLDFIFTVSAHIGGKRLETTTRQERVHLAVRARSRLTTCVPSQAAAWLSLQDDEGRNPVVNVRLCTAAEEFTHSGSDKKNGQFMGESDNEDGNETPATISPIFHSRAPNADPNGLVETIDL